jgi:acetoin utilization deacetylase AcuC-like enzyme
MTTALYTHPASLSHETPPGHPERIARMEAINARLADSTFDGLDRLDAPLADLSEVLRCHTPEYVDAVQGAIPGAGMAQLDADTWLSPGSLQAALSGVGAVTAAVDRVLAGAARNAFCAIRPPGHHAERATPMGFCLFGNVAIAAKRALDHHGLGRVAVVDFDVHHGNGTQDLLWDEGRALFVSSHQMPLWPGTGAPGSGRQRQHPERAAGAGHGGARCARPMRRRSFRG